MSIRSKEIDDLSLEDKRALLAQLLEGDAQHEQVFPVSFAQERLWFLDQLQPGNPAYNVPGMFHLPGPLQEKTLERCVNEIVRRHEMLRTVFSARDGRPVQKILPELSIALPVTDLRRIAPEALDAEVQRVIAEEARASFNLARGPLLRMQLLRMSQDGYVFLLTMHHIVSDAWSMTVFMRELVTLYDALCAGHSSRLAELPIQYKDFAVWQRKRLEDQVLHEHLSYWKTRLAGAPSMLELGTDYPRPALQTFAGALHQFALPEQLTVRLRCLSKEQGVTLFMTLLAGFNVLLSRYTGYTDIVIGSPIANRNRTEIEKLIGFFVNTLVLRTTLNDDPTFLELLQRVRETTLGAYEHQDLPFEKLVEELAPERNLSHNPLFQVMFAFQNTPDGSCRPETPQSGAESGKEGQANAGLLENQFQAAKFDLTLTIQDTAQGLSGALEYRTDLFRAETISGMAGHLLTLLEGVAALPEQRVSQLPLLTDSDRQRLLVDWNATGVDYPADALLHHLFEAQVEKTPERTAVVFEQQRLSYRELDQRAHRLSRYLQARGVGPDVPVAICIERSIEMVVALIGVLKAGGAYVPIAADYPEQRLAFMLEDVGAPVLLTQAALVGRFPGYAGLCLCLDKDWAHIAHDLAQHTAPVLSPRHLAYIIYTSGSTGQPKGVSIPHAAICNHMSWMADTWQLSETDAVLQKTPISFDAAVWEIFAPLLSGARLVLARPDDHKDGVALVETIAKQKVTVLQLVPSLLQLLLGTPGLARCDSLKRVYCGGEILPAALGDRLTATVGAKLFNLYGPTEATIDATWWDCGRDVSPSNIPIGDPIANTRIYILDQFMQPVPVGASGELYIAGSGLARGYHKRPALTAERFVPSPFSELPGERLYRTGDRARYRADGHIEFVGRFDHQVKIRGLRIEPTEIEANLRLEPTVRDVVVEACEDMPGGPRLVAYVVPDSQASFSRERLSGYLKLRLPQYMVPSAFVSLDRLPLMPNGKVDRQALPPVVAAEPSASDPEQAPRTPLENVLAGIWLEVLGIGEIGRHDNFFGLGGHSLLAAQVHARIVDTLDAEIPLRILFESPTIAELATNLLRDPVQGEQIEKTAEALILVAELGEDEVERLLDEGTLSLAEYRIP